MLIEQFEHSFQYGYIKVYSATISPGCINYDSIFRKHLERLTGMHNLLQLRDLNYFINLWKQMPNELNELLKWKSQMLELRKVVGGFLRWTEMVTTGNGTEAEAGHARPGSWLLCFLWVKNKVRLPRFWQVGAARQTVRPHPPPPIYNALDPLVTPFPTHSSCPYHGTAAACVDCYFIASAWSQRHGLKQKLFASVRGWNLISSCKLRHHNIPTSPFPLEQHHFPNPLTPSTLPLSRFAHPNYYVCLCLENWRTILQLKCEHKSRPKYNL